MITLPFHLMMRHLYLLKFMELAKKKFVDIEIGSVFRVDGGQQWQKISLTAARDLQPPAPRQFDPALVVEVLYDYGADS